MKITFHLDNGNEKVTNFCVAEAVVNLCDDTHNLELNAEVVAKMMLLQVDSRKGGEE